MEETNNLTVGEGECLVLGPESPRFKQYFTQVRPRTADEVKSVMGLSPESEKAIRDQGACCGETQRLAATVPADALDSKDEDVRAAARATTYQALGTYVSGTNSAALAHMKPTFEKFLDTTKATLNVARLQDIEVAEGATLTISKNTHVVNANKVIIHRNGRIVCHGSTNFKIASLEGNRGLISTAGFINQATITLAHK